MGALLCWVYLVLDQLEVAVVLAQARPALLHSSLSCCIVSPSGRFLGAAYSFHCGTVSGLWPMPQASIPLVGPGSKRREKKKKKGKPSETGQCHVLNRPLIPCVRVHLGEGMCSCFSPICEKNYPPSHRKGVWVDLLYKYLAIPCFPRIPLGRIQTYSPLQFHSLQLLV